MKCEIVDKCYIVYFKVTSNLREINILNVTLKNET